MVVWVLVQGPTFVFIEGMWVMQGSVPPGVPKYFVNLPTSNKHNGLNVLSRRLWWRDGLVDTNFALRDCTKINYYD